MNLGSFGKEAGPPQFFLGAHSWQFLGCKIEERFEDTSRCKDALRDCPGRRSAVSLTRDLYFPVYQIVSIDTKDSSFLSTVLSAVERYIRNVAEDVRDLATHVNENGKRLLNLDEWTREQSERVNAWHGETGTVIHDISGNILAYGSVAKKQQKNTVDNLHRIRHDVTYHRHEWRSEAKKRERGK